MKYLIWLLVALVVVWHWRSKAAKSEPPKGTRHTPTPPEALDMLACTHCGLHSPASDMVSGINGRYCSAQHRDLAES